MNHIYRIIWNHTTACYQAVTECASGKGKRGGKSRLKRAATATSAALCILSTPSFAGPTGGQVTAGSATITQNGTATTINQSSIKAAIDWTKFSVGANESVRFNQPNASAITLNRVTGTERSAIMGNISANGQVFILNPNGVLFGAGSQVNVGSLTASTLRLDNSNFMAGSYKFTGDGNGSVVNNGTIAVAPGGTIALMAPLVQNTGTLSAPSGSILLAGAQGVTLNLQSDGGLVAYTLDAGSAKALVDNGGLIEAGGGHVVLTAKGVDALSTAVVNHSGVIEAQTVSNKGGVIELLGDMQSGLVNVSGVLDASAHNTGDGGFVETSAAHVQVASTAKINNSSKTGIAGTWLIDPFDININEGMASVIGTSLNTGNVTISTAGSNTPSTSSVETSGNGDITVNSAINWSSNKLTLTASRNININANLNGTGAAKLALNYGQGTASGAGSDYVLANDAKVNLPAGENFSTKQGSAGSVNNFTVITSLGAAGSRTGTDLQGINGDINKNYILGADIDAGETAAWSGGAGFHPIYSSSYSATNRYGYGYAGVFDGMNHVVSNLTIDKTKATTDRTSPDWYFNISLFDTLSGTVKNLSLVNINYKGVSSNEGSVLGGIAGSNDGTISKVNVSGLIDGAYGGGIVGRNSTTAYSPTYMAGDNGGIVDATSTVTLVAYAGAGGITYTNDGLIKNSSYSGDITLKSVFGHGGGIFSEGGSRGSVEASFSAGIMNGPFSIYQNMGGGIAAISGGPITNSYSTMKISGFSDVAGIVVAGSGSVRNSYFAGELTYVPVIYNGIDYGSLSGISDDLTFGATVVNSYWDSAKVGAVKNQGGGTKVQLGTPKTTAEMQQQATYAGWDFVNTWRIVEGSSYPLLRALTQGTITLDVTASNARKTYDGNTILSLADLQALPGGFRVTAGTTLANGDTLPELNVAGTGIWSGTLNINGTGNTWSGARDSGIYSIVPGGLSSQKYEIVYVNGSLTIDPAVVKVVGVSGSRVYDGTRLANWNDNTQLIGVLAGDQGHVSLASGAGVLADKNVGAQSLISLGTLALGGSAAGNYQLDTTGSSWIIQPRPVSITASQSYNGATVADWRGNTYSLAGILPADTGLVNMASGVAELPSPDVGTYLLSSLGSLALGGAEAANYKLVTDRSAWNITPANLLISPSFTSKTYYMGQTAAAGSTVKILEGQLFKGDELLYGGISFLDGNAGNNKIIKITDNKLYGKVLVDDGNFGRNYFLTVQDGRGDILPRPVDIVVSKPFDGNANFISGFKVVNKGNDDVVVTGTATVNGTAGAYKGFKSYSLISSNKNYTVDQLEGVSAVIYDDYENPIIGYLTNINKGLNIEYVNGFQVDVGVTREAIPVHASDIVQTFGGSATILLNDGSAFDLPAYSMVAVSQGMTANSIIDQSITNETVRLSQEKFAEESRAEALREESEVNSRLSIPQRIFNILLEPFEPASRQTVSGGGVRG